MFVVTTPPKFLSFDEWMKENPEVLDEESDCEDCDGEGSKICFSCGHEAECETCGGAGTTNDAKFLYNQQKKRDEKLWMKGLLTNDN